MKNLFTLCLLLAIQMGFSQHWSVEKANDWYAKQPWLVGANYAPSYAINQLEMWQADTFNPQEIEKELAWAKELGFNTMRVFLHHLLWEQDAKGFLERVDTYLEIADKNGIKTMLVLFDDVWDPMPKLGKQKEPTPHVHNSGWLQSPGVELLKDASRYDELEAYVVGVISKYKNDDRVIIWDLYNEPGNTNENSYGKLELKDKWKYSLALMKKITKWARKINPKQPITYGAWTGDWIANREMSEITKYALEVSDIVSFHSYDNATGFSERAYALEKYNRPLICTEYMARKTESTFKNILPIMKEHKIAAYNWGFVSGKSQTIYPWNSWSKKYTDEPELWFHDIFRKDGSAYKKEEVEFIKEIVKK